MKILHLIPSLGGGGAERQLALLASAQVALGDDVHIAVLRGGQHLESVVESGVRVHLLPRMSHYDPRLITRLSRLVRDLRPDVVHTWLPLMDVVGGVAARLARCHWVMSERSSADAYLGTGKFLLREHLGRHADAVIANSAAGAEYWARVGVPADRRFVVANAVDIAGIAAAHPADIAGNDRGRPLVLFVGRLVQVKNLTTLLNTFALLLPRRDAIALICGEGPEKAHVSRGIEARGLNDRVTLSGYRADAWSLFHVAAATVLLSHFEGRPNVVLEAMAAGCPLVVSDIPAHREILNDDQALFVATTGPLAAARALASILDEPGLAAARADKARQAIEEYRLERIVGRFAAVYEHAVLNTGKSLRGAR